MGSLIGNLLRTTRLYRPADWVRRLLRRSRAGCAGGLDSLRAAARKAVHRLAEKLAPPPDSLLFRLLDRLHFDGPTLRLTRSTLASDTVFLNDLAGRPVDSPAGPRALVFVLRSHWYVTTVYNYLVGCALRRLGYRVSFVTCAGAVERCGNTQQGSNQTYQLPPPLDCALCRAAAAGISLQGFEVISLNDYRSDDEDEALEIFCRLDGEQMSAYELHKIPLFNTVSTFLLRYYGGDYRKIDPRREEVLSHLKAGIRYFLRYKKLLDDVRPSCLCLFNGLFFPEHLFYHEARSRKILSLFTERGLQKNTFWVSFNEPACHYRLHALWERVNRTITEEQVLVAQHYMTQRVTEPQDPLGAKRDLLDDDHRKYLALAERPYVVFFAPVTHDTSCMEKENAFGGVFGALDRLCGQARSSRKRLVVRSHPDELSPWNPSRYTVREYMADRQLLDPDYVLCLDSTEKWNPYLLARHADAVVVYNGTLGIELPCLGHEVFNLAQSHYCNKGFTTEAHSLEDLPAIFTAATQPLDPNRQRLALKYLYYYVFVASIAVGDLLDEAAPFLHRLTREAPRHKQEKVLRVLTDRLEFFLGASPHRGGEVARASAGARA